MPSSSSFPSSDPSSPSLNLSWKYDVYVSFHGADVRKSFLSHVLKEFKRNRIKTFNDNSIEPGNSIGPELLEALRRSRIAVIMLSRNYASTSWCLNELVEILKCRKEVGQVVIPIFYEVEPSDVRKQKGDFGKAFRRTCKGKSEEVISQWRSALFNVAVISGMCTREWGSESQMMEKIVICIQKKLLVSTPSSDLQCLDSDLYEDESDMVVEDLDNLVGIEAHIGKIGQMLSLDSDEVGTIGISGPLGIGKTTIAKRIYERFSHQFQFSTIMVNIKECYESNRHNEHNAILQLQSQLLSQLSNQKDIDETFHLGVAQEMLKDKKVLVVLDDVDRLGQLDALAKEIRRFGLGSRIIIIARDQRILNAYGINHIYNVDYPIPEEALQILCLSAFGQKSPHVGFLNLAQEVTTLSGYAPLGLMLMGTYLQGMSMQEWKCEIPRLRANLDGGMKSIMKFIYNPLHIENSEPHHRYITSFPHTMQEQLARSFSDMRDNINQDLEEDYGFHPRTFWPYKSRFAYLEEICLPNNTLDKLWDGVQPLGKLRWMDLSSSKNLKELPDLSTATKLEKLNVRCCSSLLELPYSIGGATSLLVLNLEYCTSLVVLPCSIGSINSLMTLYLTGCSSLVELPSSIGNAFNIQELCLSYCSNLVALPSSIGDITSLQKLNLEYCTNLVKLPSSIGNARNLVELYLNGCASLLGLPTSLSNATNLKKLNLEYCTSLAKLHSSIGDSINLKELYLIGCSSLLELPASIGNAVNLEVLEFSNCSSLEELPSSIGNMSSLNYLDLRNCSSLVKLPSSIGNAPNLEELVLNNCSNLMELPSSIGNACRLRKLDLSSCSSLVELPSSIGNAKNLEHLYLSNCSSLVRLPSSIGNATNLQYLHLNNCSSLLEVPSSLGNAKNLKKLDLSWCTSLVELPASIRNSTSLWQLDLDNCSSLLESSSSIGYGIRLKRLEL